MAFPTQSKKEDAKKFYLKVPLKVQKIIIHGNNFCPCEALIDKIHDTPIETHRHTHTLITYHTQMDTYIKHKCNILAEISNRNVKCK